MDSTGDTKFITLVKSAERFHFLLECMVALPRDPLVPWKPEVIRYWEHFADQIGRPVRPVSIPVSVSGLKVRAVSVRPTIVSRITVSDRNIVLQRPALLPMERSD